MAACDGINTIFIEPRLAKALHGPFLEPIQATLDWSKPNSPVAVWVQWTVALPWKTIGDAISGEDGVSQALKATWGRGPNIPFTILKNGGHGTVTPAVVRFCQKINSGIPPEHT